MVCLYSFNSRIDQLVGKKILMTSGNGDTLVPNVANQEFAERLQQANHENVIYIIQIAIVTALNSPFVQIREHLMLLFGQNTKGLDIKLHLRCVMICTCLCEKKVGKKHKSLNLYI